MNDIVLLNLRISMWGVSRVLPDQRVRSGRRPGHGPGHQEDPGMPGVRVPACSSSGASTAACAPWPCPAKSCGPGSTRSPWPWSRPSRRRWRTSRCAGASASWGSAKCGTCASARSRIGCARCTTRRTIPSWERVRGCFDVRWNYFAMNTPQVLQAISAKLFTREQAKATVQWNEMLEEIRDGLRLTFKELVDALVDKLTPQARRHAQEAGRRRSAAGVPGHVQQEGRGRRRATARPGRGGARAAERSGHFQAPQGSGAARAGAGADAERQGGAGHAGRGCAGAADCACGTERHNCGGIYRGVRMSGQLAWSHGDVVADLFAAFSMMRREVIHAHWRAWIAFAERRIWIGITRRAIRACEKRLGNVLG